MSKVIELKAEKHDDGLVTYKELLEQLQEEKKELINGLSVLLNMSCKDVEKDLENNINKAYEIIMQDLSVSDPFKSLVIKKQIDGIHTKYSSLFADVKALIEKESK